MVADGCDATILFGAHWFSMASIDRHVVEQQLIFEKN